MTILVPSLPPHTGGVADYAVLLARYWPEPGEMGRWIVAEGGAASRAAFPDWTIVSVDELPGGWTEALASIGNDTLLVNYAQYGFSPAGLPLELVNALREWRSGKAEVGKAETGRSAERGEGQPLAVDPAGMADSGAQRAEADTKLKAESSDGSETQLSGVCPSPPQGAPAPAIPSGQILGDLPSPPHGSVSSQLSAGAASPRRLIVYFHETWLTGPVWRRRGLVAPVARFLARRLAGAADEVITNCQLHAGQLQPALRTPPHIVPVPANIHPTAAALAAALARRANPLPAKLRVVVFGLPETRLNTLKAHADFLVWLHAGQRLAELVLLGGSGQTDRFTRKESGWLDMHLQTARVRRAVALVPEAISDELLAADLGLSAYPEAALGKSGTVAALHLQGCPVGFAGHIGGGRGWNLAMGPAGKEPVEWSILQDPAARADRRSVMHSDCMEAGNWSAHARRLRALI